MKEMAKRSNRIRKQRAKRIGGMDMDREAWRERENIYACWLCNFPDIGNKQLHRLADLCGGPEGVYLADKEKWGQVLTPRQVESLARYTAAWKPEAQYRKMKEEGIPGG